MISLLLGLAAVGLGPSEPTIDAAQFARLMDGISSRIEDFELVVEGTEVYVGRDDPERVALFNRTFQANYAFRRRDAATYLDMYSAPHNADTPAKNWTFAIRGAHQESMGLQAGAPPHPPRIQNQTIPGQAMCSGSPERIMFHGLWRRALDHPDHWTYRFEGWEEVDGRRCARVAFEYADARAAGHEVVERIWIDLERDAHALRYEFTHDGELWLRAADIQLRRFPLGEGATAWFPVHGVVESFASEGGGSATEPYLRETIDLVRGTLVFNQGLSDRRFSIHWKGHKADSEAMRATRTLIARQIAARSAPVPRTDPAGVEQWQRTMLAEADRQALQLDASAPARRAEDRALAVQIGLVASGVLIILLAWFRRRTM